MSHTFSVHIVKLTCVWLLDETVSANTTYLQIIDRNNAYCVSGLFHVFTKFISLYVTGSGKRYVVAHIFKIELLAPRGRVSSQL